MISFFKTRLSKEKIKRFCSITFGVFVFASAHPAFSETSIRGLDPYLDATYIPKLEGILNTTAHNQYGQKRDLSECIVLRRSSIKDNKVNVPAGGFYYASDTSYEARPYKRDPMLILGELSYIVGLKTGKMVKKDIQVQKGEKALVDPDGYRIWFDYATDHYRKPYAELALISPAGGWVHEWALSTSFPGSDTVKHLKLEEGILPQQQEFIMNSAYLYGATKLVAKEITFEKAEFSLVEYPVINEAIISMDRPYTVSILQESFRWYRNMRIYTFRKENGILVEVRNWSGNTVLASKLLVPATQQEYKLQDAEQMSLTLMNLDMHIELTVEPDWAKYSDFAPWVNGVPFGWEDGTVVMSIYDDLIEVKNGKPWPRDERYIVKLEPNLETGMLQRFVLENREAFTLGGENDRYLGPIKISEVWDRPYFNLVIGEIKDNVIYDYYIRDSFFRRTDNLVLWKSGKENIDLFIGMSPLVISVMEDTFLQRLADPTYGVPIVKSTFTSYPEVVPDAKWFAPQPDAAFVPKMKGFVRKYVKNREDYRLTASEVLVIRRSYVDYRNGKIVIPPGGLYYSTRDSRNIRPGEPLYILGKKAYLERFKSYLVVKKNFKLDRWKEQPMGDGNPLFWQDVPLGDGSKAMRYMGTRFVDGRPVAELRIIKYSGNDWGANILVAPGLFSYGDLKQENLPAGEHLNNFKYFLPGEFGEGSTYLIPKWVTPDYVEVAEMGTPGMDEFTITYEEPQRADLKPGEVFKFPGYSLKLVKIDQKSKTVAVLLSNEKGEVVASKEYGPLTQELYNTLPQYGPSQMKLQMVYQDVQIDLNAPVDFSTGQASFYIATQCQTFERDKPWPNDPRFRVIPDVCGHCYQLNELILDNKEPIILDKDNPVFEGPEGYFKIVVDDFDGEAINAWHIEDVEGKKTPNLAEYARNNLDVLVGVNGTTESFLRKTLLQRLAYREIWRLK